MANMAGPTSRETAHTNIMNTQNMLNATDAVFATRGQRALGVAAGTIVCRSSLTRADQWLHPAQPPRHRRRQHPLPSPMCSAIPSATRSPNRRSGAPIWRSPPFATWAGDVSVAVGGEWREESIRGYVPPQYQPTINRDANGVAVSTSNTWSRRELSADQRPLQRQGSLSRNGRAAGAGARVQRCSARDRLSTSTSGYVTTWKVGGTWQPIRDIRFRVDTIARHPRAPISATLYYQAGGSNSDSVTNPFYSATDPSKGTGDLQLLRPRSSAIPI